MCCAGNTSLSGPRSALLGITVGAAEPFALPGLNVDLVLGLLGQPIRPLARRVASCDQGGLNAVLPNLKAWLQCD